MVLISLVVSCNNGINVSISSDGILKKKYYRDTCLRTDYWIDINKKRDNTTIAQRKTISLLVYRVPNTLAKTRLAHAQPRRTKKSTSLERLRATYYANFLRRFLFPGPAGEGGSCDCRPQMSQNARCLLLYIY